MGGVGVVPTAYQTKSSTLVFSNPYQQTFDDQISLLLPGELVCFKIQAILVLAKNLNTNEPIDIRSRPNINE